MPPIEVFELMDGRIAGNQLSRTVAILFPQHERIRRLEGILILRVEKSVERPADVLFILGQRTFIAALFRCKYR